MAQRDRQFSKMSPQQLIRSLMAGAGMKPPDAVSLDEAASFIKRSLPSSAPPKKTHASEWRDGFVRLLNLFPRSTRPYGGRATLSIDKVYANGMIVGTCLLSSNTFNLFVQRDGSGRLAGCSCQASDGRYACEHSYMFVQHILDELSDSTSELAVMVEARKFETGNQDMSLFAYDNSLQILSMLERITKVDLAPSVSLDELSPSLEREPTRVAWNINATHHGMKLEPLLQTAKKRGGFGKGKRTRLGSLFQADLLLSPADERVRALVEGNNDYHNSNLTLPFGEAIHQLVGEPNVQLNGEPATLAAGCGILHLVKRADG